MNKNTLIHWPQIIVLLILNVFLVISWLIYDNFQPQLLGNFNLQDKKFHFDIVHLVVMVLVPVLAGSFSDKFFKNNQSKFLLITVGVSVTAVIFMATGSVIKINESGNTSNLSMLFLILFTLWMVAMNLFNSPANSFLEKYSPASQLPFIVSIYTVLSELVLAFESKVESIVVSLGVVNTLVGAGFVMAILGFVFFKINNKNFDSHEEIVAEAEIKYPILKIVIIGLILGSIMGTIKFVVPLYPASELDPVYSFIIAAVLAIPVGLYLKNDRLLFAFIVGMLFFGMAMLNINHNNMYLNYLFLGIALSTTSVSALPMIIKIAQKNSIAFHIGLFFGASELSEGLIELLINL